MPGWTAGPILPPDMKSFVNKQTRVIQHDGSIVKEDDLDSWWEEAASIAVDEVIFLSRHTAVSNRPALTVHPIESHAESQHRRPLAIAQRRRSALCQFMGKMSCSSSGTSVHSAKRKRQQNT
ncbi:hypothetical protein Bca52824_068617 [Brassica carinata]|uniref:Uncharacterized protein n=1 Tax=Brassica carinata TaxID=52824 RepID=A0A8X7Q272_BRACI|nr:hypothetical protein Bca52824_068617 [Brassica carinata]